MAGIVECEIIQWFVQPGAHVEEFSPLCEVQSDKASVEITSRFSGVVKKLYYEAGEMAKVGKPFVDIDIPEDVAAPAAAETTPTESSAASGAEQAQGTSFGEARATEQEQQKTQEPSSSAPSPPPKLKFSGSALATPAVRHLSKQQDVDITQIYGTGKDGRVTKEDVQKYVEERKRGGAAAVAAQEASSLSSAVPQPLDAENAAQQETAVAISGTQLQMFKTMTRSLAIPHFLYSDEIDFTQLFKLRRHVNASLGARAAAVAKGTPVLGAADPAAGVSKISYLPFVIKAMSMALNQYPILNARVDLADSNGSTKPRLIYRSQHNIGVAMDTPTGLVVPVVRNVNARSVLSIARELARLQGLAQAGKLAPADLQGGTITVSNIGNVGGTYLSPVIVEREVAILGIGRLRTVPAFADDGDDAAGAASQQIVKRHVCHFSFSADHRVVDGATMARAAEVVREMLEKPDMMILELR